MKLKNLYPFILIIIFACKAEEKQKPAYTLKTLKSGITLEIFSDEVDDENKYNYDNTVLVPGTILDYSIEIYSKDGKELFFKRNQDKAKNYWEFTDKNDPDAITLSKIAVDKGNNMATWNPGYYQTNLKYFLGSEKTYSMSGGIENEANIWIHPHRDLYLEILEINPFPYVKAPYKVGTKWNWALEIGNGWKDERWAIWEGNIINKYNYEIVKEEVLETPFGKLNCFVINSEGKSDIGTTKLISYFHKKYGFVKLDYTNIDASKTILTLKSHTQK